MHVVEQENMFLYLLNIPAHPDNAWHLLPGAFHRFSTAPATAADEEPIKPPVEVKYTQLLINGNFVDAASGTT
jgi:aldehyde dehydrogenase (NAD+)